MRTLLLRLAGPAQSWSGVQLYPTTVQTERIPTRSGLLGLLACCLGAPAGAWPGWLEEIELYVRVDKPGDIASDFQTVNGVPKHLETHFARTTLAENPRRRWPQIELAGEAYNLRHRRFLADAEFVLAVCHEQYMPDLAAAVTSPRFMPYLGRKAFAPTFPFVLGTTPASPREALEQLPTVTAQPASAVVLELYPVLTDRNVTHEQVSVTTATREEQLAWASLHLSR